MCLFVIDSPQVPLVLGQHWVIKHNLHLDGKRGNIISCSVFFQLQCLCTALYSEVPKKEEKEFPDLSMVPAEYLGLKQLVSMPWASSLPLLPVSLSISERKEMDEYISSVLTSGVMWPSLSPAGAGFFFMEKKDESLWPCIDYHFLN